MPTVVDRETVQQLLRDAGAQLVEVLPRDEYEEEHLPDAVHLPLKELDADAARAIDPGQPVIVYCWDGL